MKVYWTLGSVRPDCDSSYKTAHGAKPAGVDMIVLQPE